MYSRVVVSTIFAALLAFADESPVDLIRRSTELQQAGRLNESIALMKDLLRQPGLSPTMTGLALNELGLGLQVRNEYAPAEAAYLRSLRVLAQAADAPPVFALHAHMNLCSLYLETHDINKAEYHLSQVPFDQLSLPADRAQILNMKAGIAAVRNHPDEARRAYEQGLMWLRRAGTKGAELEIATTLNNLGVLSFRLADWAEAERWLDQAQAAHREANGDKHPDLAKILSNLGVAQANLGKYPRALDSLKEASQIAEASLGRVHPITVGILYSYAEVLNRSGDRKLAKAKKKEADLIAKELPPWVPTGLTVDASALQSGFRK